MKNHPVKHAWKPSQNRLMGLLLTTSGFLIFIGSLVPAMMLENAGPEEYILFVLVIVMFGGGAAMMIQGKRHLTRRSEDVLATDERPPVVFLRSFDDEFDEFSMRGYFRAVGAYFSNRGTGLAISPWGPTFQSQMAMMMERIGPYIAVGRPGAKLPGTGAARMYIPDDEWKEKVSDLLDQTQLVIIKAGTSDGLNWEIENVMKHMSPRKLLVILPFSRKDYATFRQSVDKIGINLPEKIPNTLFMTFDDNWQPIFLKVNGKLEQTLIPYFKANNIEPPRPSMWDAVRLFFH